VAIPPGYGLSLDTGLSYEAAHVYRSTPGMSLSEADCAQRAVIRYYRRALDDWIVVEEREGYLEVKEADSSHGFVISADIDENATGRTVILWIRPLDCPEEYWCINSSFG
jgi:hypothetical protein